MFVDTTSQRLQASDILNKVCATSVILEVQLYSAEMQTAVGNNYGKLQSPFNNFQNILKKPCQKRPKRQAILTDMFSRASISK